MTTASELLAVAKSQIGITSGSKYWKFVFPSYKFIDGNRTPYCACFCSWVADQAKQKVDGLPAGYCPYILNVWRKSGRMHPAKEAKAGDFVTFDWQGDGISDHIGIVESNDGTALHTIEGNTNGGKVMRRTRAYKTVSGCYRPAYAEAKPKPQPSPTAKKTIAQLADEVLKGKWGSGAERVKRLKEAGYDYDLVQKEVNAMLEAKAGNRYKVNARDGLNVRKGAGTKYAKIGALGYGTIVTVREQRNGWGRIDAGWVYMQYLTRL